MAEQVNQGEIGTTFDFNPGKGYEFTVHFPKPKKPSFFSISNLFRIFSQKGLGTGISSSPQYEGEGIGILGSDSTTVEDLRSDFGCCCNPCNEIFSDLYCDFSAYHSCNAAHFDLYVLDFTTTRENAPEDGEESKLPPPQYWVWCGPVNVNSFKEQQEFDRGSNSTTPDYDFLQIPEDTLAIANQGKTEEECCQMKFLLWPAPWPSRVFLTNEYMLVTDVDWNWSTIRRWKRDDPGYDPNYYVKALTNTQLDPRESEGMIFEPGDVHRDVTRVTIQTPRIDPNNPVTTGEFIGPYTEGTPPPIDKGDIYNGCCVLQSHAEFSAADQTEVDLCTTCDPETPEPIPPDDE